MAERHRALPSWMAKKKKEKVTEAEPPKSRTKRKTARAAFYLMNERELVQAAVSYLTNGACEDVALHCDQQVEERAADTTVKRRETPSKTVAAKPTTAETSEREGSDNGGDQEETTCVSETDLDITDMETFPYTKSQQDHSSLMNVGLEAEGKEARSQMPADAPEEDDDALRLVREIFFT